MQRGNRLDLACKPQFANPCSVKWFTNPLEYIRITCKACSNTYCWLSASEASDLVDLEWTLEANYLNKSLGVADAASPGTTI